MAQYDPQRSRTRHRKADEEGPAPVDALLGPDPAPDPPAPPEPEPELDLRDDPAPVPPVVPVVVIGPTVAEGESSSIPWIDPRPGPQPGPEPGGSRRRVAVGLAALLALIAVLLWAGLRRRRRPGPASGDV
jgi:hypothetical protein